METHRTSTRRITGLQPTGHLQLGNLLAAVRPMVAGQHDVHTLAFIADQHALTVDHDPARLAGLTREAAAILLAAGLDPVRCVLFVQSQVPEHAVAHYLLESTATFGESRRMIQFREKAGGQESVRLSLLTYPVLMAADILLYAGVGQDVEVPVGEDQGQHLELVRALGRRFNRRYGLTFALPRGVQPGSGARIMDLAEPGRKMEKTNPATAGVVFVLDPPDVVRRKILRAVTDGDRVVAYDPVTRPGVSNLLDILGCVLGRSATGLAGSIRPTPGSRPTWPTRWSRSWSHCSGDSPTSAAIRPNWPGCLPPAASERPRWRVRCWPSPSSGWACFRLLMLTPGDQLGAMVAKSRSDATTTLM